MLKSRQKIIMAGVFVAMIAFLAAILFGDKGYMELRHLRSDHDRLRQTNARLTRENLQVYRTIDRLKNDPLYVENIARQELGMIRADELIFTFKQRDTAR